MNTEQIKAARAAVKEATESGCPPLLCAIADTALDEIERLMNLQTQAGTLIACAKCGYGVRPSYAINGLCHLCAGYRIAVLEAQLSASRAEIARLQTQLAACRREALEEAAKAVCHACGAGLPRVGNTHINMDDGGCYASHIHQLIEKEANGT